MTNNWHKWNVTCICLCVFLLTIYTERKLYEHRRSWRNQTQENCPPNGSRVHNPGCTIRSQSILGFWCSSLMFYFPSFSHWVFLTRLEGEWHKLGAVEKTTREAEPGGESNACITRHLCAPYKWTGDDFTILIFKSIQMVWLYGEVPKYEHEESAYGAGNEDFICWEEHYKHYQIRP